MGDAPYQRPAVGRVVHYVARGSADGKFGKVCRAAIVTDVRAPSQRPEDGSVVDTVSLAVLNPTGLFFDRDVHLDEGDDTGDHTGGTWHWPERV